MYVTMTQAMVGSRFTREVGNDYEVDDAEGERLIAAGFANYKSGERGEVKPRNESAKDGPTPQAKPKRGRPPKERPSPTGGPNDTAVATLPDLPSNDNDEDDTP